MGRRLRAPKKNDLGCLGSIVAVLGLVGVMFVGCVALAVVGASGRKEAAVTEPASSASPTTAASAQTVAVATPTAPVAPPIRRHQAPTSAPTSKPAARRSSPKPAAAFGCAECTCRDGACGCCGRGCCSHHGGIAR